jgi:hypothetical protein
MQGTMGFARFRRSETRESELGKEKYCFTCGEFWPADEEFFDRSKSSKDKLAPRCIACSRARLWVPYSGTTGKRGGAL